jgi:hypothetical protein
VEPKMSAVDLSILKLLREETQWGWAIKMDTILHYHISQASLDAAAAEGWLDVILWGSAFGRLRPRYLRTTLTS